MALTRTTWLLAAFGLVLTAAVLVAVAGAGAEAAAEPEASEAVLVVGEGDTLWGLAPEGVEDPHAWAADVADRNDVAATGLRPGQALRVPAGAGR